MTYRIAISHSDGLLGYDVKWDGKKIVEVWATDGAKTELGPVVKEFVECLLRTHEKNSKGTALTIKLTPM